jgi:hypothetical protein
MRQCDGAESKHASVPLRRVRTGERRREKFLYGLTTGSTGSFVRSLRAIRRQVIAHPTVSPDQIAAIHCAIEELLTGLLPSSAAAWTLTPTAVKHNMSNDQLKRAQHRIWPQQIMPPTKALTRWQWS